MRNVSDEMKNVSVECHVGKQKKYHLKPLGF